MNVHLQGITVDEIREFFACHVASETGEWKYWYKDYNILNSVEGKGREGNVRAMDLAILEKLRILFCNLLRHGCCSLFYRVDWCAFLEYSSSSSVSICARVPQFLVDCLSSSGSCKERKQIESLPRLGPYTICTPSRPICKKRQSNSYTTPIPSSPPLPPSSCSLFQSCAICNSRLIFAALSSSAGNT